MSVKKFDFNKIQDFAKRNPILAVASVITIPLIALVKRYFNGPLAKIKDLNGKVIIVTGASDGIGIHTARELLNSGATVILACRNELKTKAVIESFNKEVQGRAQFMYLDLAKFKTIKNLLILSSQNIVSLIF